MNEMNFPPHKAGMHLEHNTHKNVYESVEEFCEDDFYKDAWVSEEEKQLAIKNNDLWILQWYPETPIGFYTLCASSLEVLLKHANEVS